MDLIYSVISESEEPIWDVYTTVYTCDASAVADP